MSRHKVITRRVAGLGSNHVLHVVHLLDLVPKIVFLSLGHLFVCPYKVVRPTIE